MMYDDLDVKAILDAMNRRNQGNKEKKLMEQIQNKYSYWLRWYIGIQTNLTDINNDWR